MSQPRVAGNSSPSIYGVKGRSIGMSLPAGERRDPIRRAAIVHRITAEFREMPGLVLTVRQASRLLGLDESACERILASLAKDGLLRRRTSGSYGAE